MRKTGRPIHLLRFLHGLELRRDVHRGDETETVQDAGPRPPQVRRGNGALWRRRPPFGAASLPGYLLTEPTRGNPLNPPHLRGPL